MPQILDHRQPATYDAYRVPGAGELPSFLRNEVVVCGSESPSRSAGRPHGQFFEVDPVTLGNGMPHTGGTMAITE